MMKMVVSAMNMDIKFSQQDMPYLRQRFLYDILKNRSSWDYVETTINASSSNSQLNEIEFDDETVYGNTFKPLGGPRTRSKSVNPSEPKSTRHKKL